MKLQYAITIPILKKDWHSKENSDREKWEARDTADGTEKDQKYRGNERSARIVHIRAREESDVLLFSIKWITIPAKSIGKERFTRQERPITRYLYTHYLAVHITEIYIEGAID